MKLQNLAEFVKKKKLKKLNEESFKLKISKINSKIKWEIQFTYPALPIKVRTLWKIIFWIKIPLKITCLGLIIILLIKNNLKEKRKETCSISPTITFKLQSIQILPKIQCSLLKILHTNLILTLLIQAYHLSAYNNERWWKNLIEKVLQKNESL